MPKLIIDKREISVPEGTPVIDAAAALGIMIPRFCYHPALGSVGACRVCAVMFLDGPVKGIQMSCMVMARDGMVVSTTDADAVDFRRHVIEWLMVNHPHDCPVCDEGGHCLLQDMTVSGGHGIRRFEGRKRTHRDQDLGPLVAHEMNRCIQCYRCTRYYREYAGYEDLGVMGIGARVYFGRRRDGALESPFAGNLVDICPTGVYTDRPSRYKGRRWDFERHPSICLNCSLGCHTTASVRYREVIRLEARYSAAVNGHFICDRGRYGAAYASAPDRPRQALVRGQPTNLPGAVADAAKILAGITAQGGAASVAVAGAGRSSLETVAAMTDLCRAAGYRAPVFHPTAAQAAAVSAVAERLREDRAVSMADLAAADGIVVVGADPVNEAPMLALALRRAWRAGAWVTVIDPRAVRLPFAAEILPAAPSDLHRCVSMLTAPAADTQTTDGASPDLAALLAPVARRLNACRRPVMVCGTGLADAVLIHRAADWADAMAGGERRPGLFFITPGANALAAAVVSGGAGGLDRVLGDIESGAVRALVLVEYDPFHDYPHRRRLASCLKRLEALIVIDNLAGPAVDAATVFLPAATVFESGGTFMNQEGWLQRAPAVFRGGLPASQETGGAHPPRVFRGDAPGTDPAPAWQILGALAAGGILPAAFSWPRAAHPLFSLAAEAALTTAGGVCGLMNQAAGPLSAPAPQVSAPAGGFVLMAVDAVFGSEALSSRSVALQALEPAPSIQMHPADAAGLGLAGVRRVTIDTGLGNITAPLATSAGMARGVIAVSRCRGLDWQWMTDSCMPIGAGNIRSADGGPS